MLSGESIIPIGVLFRVQRYKKYFIYANLKVPKNEKFCIYSYIKLKSPEYYFLAKARLLPRQFSGNERNFLNGVYKTLEKVEWIMTKKKTNNTRSLHGFVRRLWYQQCRTDNHASILADDGIMTNHIRNRQCGRETNHFQLRNIAHYKINIKKSVKTCLS